MCTHKISIIIPTLNEAKNSKQLILYLLNASLPTNIAEIIIVDGGSTDGTKKNIYSIIEKTHTLSTFCNQPNIYLLTTQKGRAKQMNLGAKKATGNILYFLHADSFPPQNFDKDIINQIKKGNLAGCFRMQFNHSHWWLRLSSWFTQFNWQICRGGDQSQFVTKKLFKEIGGFNEQFIIYEDNDLIRKLYAKKQFIVINKKLKTSARLYKKTGIWKLQYHFLVIHIKKKMGKTPENLYTYYLNNIKK